MITVIIPVRLSEGKIYDETARIIRIANTVPRELYSILIVDYGTKKRRRKELLDICESFDHVEIFRVNIENAPFSIGHARDIGVQEASSSVIMFHDIDFLCSPETYKRIYHEVRIRKLDQRGYDFICVPTTFLTTSGTDFYLNMHETGRGYDADQMIHDHVLKGRKQFFQHAALGSSATIINRYYYLTSGGHDRSFVGHGAEDFEFYHRLAIEAPRSIRPSSYYENIRDFEGKYEGFRAFFALFGADLWMRGIALVHLEHPRREAIDSSYKRSDKNFALLKKRMIDADRGAFQVKPLMDPGSRQKTLVLVDPKSRPAKAIRQIIPALGEYEYFPEGNFSNAKAFLDTIKAQNFTQVFFLNPYGNKHRQSLYQAVQKKSVPFFTFDRGALPHSWFIDSGGFLNDSKSYSPKKWNHALNQEETSIIRSWVEEFRSSDDTLEKNDIRQSALYWRDQLNIGKRKVILVASQRPYDTATVFFAGKVGSTNNFNHWITYLAENLDPTKYTIVVKKHPLEDKNPDISSVTFAPASAHIHDLIELSEKVIVINSGVGLLSLIFDKPVITCGDAFYAYPGLAYCAKSKKELLELAKTVLTNDTTVVSRFLYFLVFEFYSFGKSINYSTIDQHGKNISIVSKINFREIRYVTKEVIHLGEIPNEISLESHLLRAAGSRNYKPVKQTGRWNILQWVVYHAYKLGSSPFQGTRAAAKLRNDPIKFFIDTKSPANQFIGRILINKTQRSY